MDAVTTKRYRRVQKVLPDDTLITLRMSELKKGDRFILEGEEGTWEAQRDPTLSGKITKSLDDLQWTILARRVGKS